MRASQLSMIAYYLKNMPDYQPDSLRQIAEELEAFAAEINRREVQEESRIKGALQAARDTARDAS